MRLVGWNGATVAAIETGKRAVSLGEALLLTSALRPAGRSRSPSLADLLSAPMAERVDVDGVIMSGQQLRRLAEGNPPPGILLPDRKRPGAVDVDPDVLREYSAIAKRLGVRRTGKNDIITMALDSIGDVENRAARKLGVSSFEIVAASYALWGRTITEERDDRLKEATGESRRGQRGHITRKLFEELNDVLRASKKRRRPS